MQNSSESKDSVVTLLIDPSKGDPFSIQLPKHVTNFKDFMLVDVYTGDSDPVYWAVAKAYNNPLLGRDWATRFSVAMLAFYHLETAFNAAEQPEDEFWPWLELYYPSLLRGGARRHFRGPAGFRALEAMRAFGPNASHWFDGFPTQYEGVKRMCESELQQFGPYFQLKVCDYMDRCLDMPITTYAGLERNLPSEPLKGLALVPRAPNFTALCAEAKEWGILKAPDFAVPVGPAEVETSLCGWKTTKVRGNWFGADILEKHQSLATLAHQNERAAMFKSFLPPIIGKDLFQATI